MTKAGVRRIILLTLGYEDLPRSISIYGAPPEERMLEPTPGVLLEVDGGWVMLDTGFNAAIVRDPAMSRRFYPDPTYYRPVLTVGADQEPIEYELERVGLSIDDIAAVGISHLHHDHSGGIKHFAGRVPIHMQRKELEHGLTGGHYPTGDALIRVDYDDPRIDWKLADGEAEIAPGITAIPTYGHTPGNQSFMVELDESVGGGGFVFAFDAADLTENIEQELPLGGFVGDDPEITLEPIRRLKAIAQEKGYRLIPGHDPVVWPALTEEMAKRFAVAPV
jgi:glyoxylase-like metal-dependent hydrolase (beta-lactamase superfamily II)